MTVDRFIAISYPYRASTLCTPRRAQIAVVVTFIAMVIYNLPYMLYSKVSH